MRQVAILGAGRLGESMLRGILSSGWRSAGDVVVTSRRPERLADLRDRFGVEGTSDNAAAVDETPLVILSVKPQDMPIVLAEIATAVDARPDTALGGRRHDDTVHRRAPAGRARASSARCRTRPALVHEGIAGLCGGEHARDEDVQLAAEALGHLGAVVRVDEQTWTPSPRCPGPGPAYFALLAEAMIEAGLLLGLSRDISTQLVVQTMFGSALLLRDEKMHPVELREAVTSPGGTTTRAIRELERSGVRAAFLNAITAATERSRELANE